MDRNIYALVSVTDKRNLRRLGCLEKLGVKFISTGNTGRVLSEFGFDVTDISDFTGMPEMLDGRLKTLHHRVAGCILADRKNPDHVRQCEKHDFPHIAFVMVNLYDFEGKPGIENIDIGGPILLRGAAKNFGSTTVIVDPDDYEMLEEQLEGVEGFEEYMENSEHFRRRMAQVVFETTSGYDGDINEWMLGELG